MARDSLFGETILWSGRPAVLTTPPAFRLAAWVAAIFSVSTLAFAVVIARGLGGHVGGMLSFSAWCAVVAIAAWRGPLWWASRVEYLVTDRHVIWRRGRLRRSIDRAAISFARIHWLAGQTGVGDLTLVRAVPTGALRRTLKLTLGAVEAPDRVWATVRGVEPCAPLGDGDRPLAQRLDEGERVLWTAIPVSSPWTPRRVASGLAGLVLFVAAVHSVIRVAGPMHRVLGLHALGPAVTAIFVGGVSLGVLVLVAAGGMFAYGALVRPALLARSTRYFVTNRRVLIRRGREELLLDRSRIAYVIATRANNSLTQRGSLHDVFLVLDGPQARALAASGAFGEGRRDTLSPVFAAIQDPDAVGAILSPSPRDHDHKAAA
jgi:hypothetical protein